MKADFENFKLDQGTAIGEMERRHTAEIEKLRAEKYVLEQTFGKNIGDLKFKLNLQIQQNQQKQESLRNEHATESSAKQANLEQQLNELKEQQEKMLKQQSSSKDLKKKIEQLEKEQQQAKHKNETVAQSQNRQLSDQLHKLELEKNRLEIELKQKEKEFERKLTKQMLAKEETLRTKHLTELHEMKEAASQAKILRPAIENSKNISLLDDQTLDTIAKFYVLKALSAPVDSN